MLDTTKESSTVTTEYWLDVPYADHPETRIRPRSKEQPDDGPINLVVQDLPHSSSATEWWYVNSHLETESGLKLSLFASFFRIILEVDEETGQLRYAHALNWAISDPASGKYYADSCVDQCAPEIGLKRLERGEWKTDPLLRQALREILERGQVPHPDRLIEGPVVVDQKKLALDYSGNRFRKLEDGSYKLLLFNDEDSVGCELIFHPQKEPVHHGDNGIVRGVMGEDMFYYFIPRCRVEGAITIGGQSLPLKAGSGWYDHEFALPAKTDEEN